MKRNGVLCAIDVNDFDQEVVDIAASFAKHFQRDLDLLHVTDSINPTSAAWTAYFGTPLQLSVDNQRLKRINTNVDGVRIVRHQASGSPVNQILGFAERNSPRILIIGQHRRNGIQKLMGDAATKIMRKANCPVLVYRERNPVPLRPERESTTA